MCVKDDRTHADDFDGLMYAAQSALRQALDDGESKGFEPGDWLKHTICRLLMLWARVEPPPVCFELA
jgi:hypothetical protein